jgi:hypothetical protein
VKKNRARQRGAMTTETTVLIFILGLGSLLASIAAGVRLHQHYRTSRVTLACPFP